MTQHSPEPKSLVALVQIALRALEARKMPKPDTISMRPGLYEGLKRDANVSPEHQMSTFLGLRIRITDAVPAGTFYLSRNASVD